MTFWYAFLCDETDSDDYEDIEVMDVKVCVISNVPMLSK